MPSSEITAVNRRPSNERLQRTRAARLLQSCLRETPPFGGARRAPLMRKPLGDLVVR